jgi:hypothetical protein
LSGVTSSLIEQQHSGSMRTPQRTPAAPECSLSIEAAISAECGSLAITVEKRMLTLTQDRIPRPFDSVGEGWDYSLAIPIWVVTVPPLTVGGCDVH